MIMYIILPVILISATSYLKIYGSENKKKEIINQIAKIILFTCLFIYVIAKKYPEKISASINEIIFGKTVNVQSETLNAEMEQTDSVTVEDVTEFQYNTVS